LLLLVLLQLRCCARAQLQLQLQLQLLRKSPEQEEIIKAAVKVIDSIRSKVSKSLKGIIKYETAKINHVLGAQKKKQSLLL
jgi:hypothetical protein